LAAIGNYPSCLKSFSKIPLFIKVTNSNTNDNLAQAATHQTATANHSQHFTNYLNSNEFGIFLSNNTTSASAVKQSAMTSINIVFETKIKIIEILQVNDSVRTDSWKSIAHG
jgi:hypothetical protein